jgi:hypothetical protein
VEGCECAVQLLRGFEVLKSLILDCFFMVDSSKMFTNDVNV